MSMPPDRRTRKRLATRQGISDIATRLFFERGFDAVTVGEIAEAADVGRMTVFNHFPRKEDMFFDRDEEGRETICEALRQRDPAIAPMETLRLLAHRLVSEKKPFIRFSPGSRKFVETIEASETLKARARAIRDELSHLVARALSECVGREAVETDARLAADMLVATWATAAIEAHRVYKSSGSEGQAQTVFLDIVDKGAAGIKAALAGTPYA